jgi:hypothetical protein
MKRLFTLVLSMMCPCVLFAQTSPSWQYTGAMNSVRFLAEMVTLDNGTALVVGGDDGSQSALASCELYDPATASWSYTGSLKIARAYPTIVKLSNGHVLSMCGGVSMGTAMATNAVEDYDPATGQWTVVGHLVQARYCPTATLMNDGRILMAGGITSSDGTSSSCEIYDPSTSTSTVIASMHLPRATHQTVLLNNGKVLVTGGRDGGARSDYFNECDLFDPTTGTWTAVSPMLQSRTMGALTTFSDGTVLAAGGRNAPLSLATGSEIFDPTTMTWSSTSPINEPVHWTAGVLLPGDRYMVTGGIIDAQLMDPSGLSVATTLKCEWYDKTVQQWYFAPQLNLTRCRHDATYIHQTVNAALPSDLILVAGGQQGSIVGDSAGLHTGFQEGFTNTAEILDVTQPAMKAYMKMKINTQGVTSPSENVNTFKAFYEADGSIKVQYICQNDAVVSLAVMSVDGRMTKQFTDVPSGVGLHSMIISTNDLSAGTYFVRYLSTSENHIFKFIVR